MPKLKTIYIEDEDQAYLDRHQETNFSGLVREMMKDLRILEATQTDMKKEEAKQ
jgi:hypothetical protein